ncbi:hypothetical protein PR048_025849, partial [Dryococelus australis]
MLLTAEQQSAVLSMTSKVIAVVEYATKRVVKAYSGDLDRRWAGSLLYAGEYVGRSYVRDLARNFPGKLGIGKTHKCYEKEGVAWGDLRARVKGFPWQMVMVGKDSFGFVTFLILGNRRVSCLAPPHAPALPIPLGLSRKLHAMPMQPQAGLMACQKNRELVVCSVLFMLQEVTNMQRGGTYNIVGISCGGVYAIEVAKQLQAQGEKTHVFLLDGFPQTNQAIARCLGDGSQQQVNLLITLLNLNYNKVGHVTDSMAVSDCDCRRRFLCFFIGSNPWNYSCCLYAHSLHHTTAQRLGICQLAIPPTHLDCAASIIALSLLSPVTSSLSQGPLYKYRPWTRVRWQVCLITVAEHYSARACLDFCSFYKLYTSLKLNHHANPLALSANNSVFRVALALSISLLTASISLGTVGNWSTWHAGDNPALPECLLELAVEVSQQNNLQTSSRRTRVPVIILLALLTWERVYLLCGALHHDGGNTKHPSSCRGLGYGDNPILPVTTGEECLTGVVTFSSVLGMLAIILHLPEYYLRAGSGVMEVIALCQVAQNSLPSTGMPRFLNSAVPAPTEHLLNTAITIYFIRAFPSSWVVENGQRDHPELLSSTVYSPSSSPPNTSETKADEATYVVPPVTTPFTILPIDGMHTSQSQSQGRDVMRPALKNSIILAFYNNFLQMHQTLTQLPDWNSRLHSALTELQVPQSYKDNLAIAIDSVYSRINTLLNYCPDETMLNGEGTLILLNNIKEDDYELYKVELDLQLIVDSHVAVLSQYTLTEEVKTSVQFGSLDHGAILNVPFVMNDLDDPYTANMSVRGLCMSRAAVGCLLSRTLGAVVGSSAALCYPASNDPSLEGQDGANNTALLWRALPGWLPIEGKENMASEVVCFFGVCRRGWECRQEQQCGYMLCYALLTLDITLTVLLVSPNPFKLSCPTRLSPAGTGKPLKVYVLLLSCELPGEILRSRCGTGRNVVSLPLLPTGGQAIRRSSRCRFVTRLGPNLTRHVEFPIFSATLAGPVHLGASSAQYFFAPADNGFSRTRVEFRWRPLAIRYPPITISELVHPGFFIYLRLVFGDLF